MCRLGNGSFWKFCSDAIIKQYGRETGASKKLGLSNKEMREILKQHGGCMKK